MSTVEVVVPVFQDQDAPEQRSLASRSNTLRDKRLTLIFNRKPKGKELLTMVGDRLRERAGVASVELYTKAAASVIIDDSEVKAIADRSDIVITGLGDCGACSACSLADAIKMETAGVPSTILITDVFSGNCASFAATMGMPGYHTVAFPHPVSSKDDGQLERYAEKVIDQVIVQLTDKLVAQKAI